MPTIKEKLRGYQAYIRWLSYGQAEYREKKAAEKKATLAKAKGE